MVRDRTFGSQLFNILNLLLLAVMGLICIIPLLHILAVSFSDRAATIAHLVVLWPIRFNLENYSRILGFDQFRRSFNISVMRVVGGTIIGMLVTVLTAYPLSLRENFMGKSLVRWLLIFSMLFSGGLIPWYLTLKSLHLINNLWGLILPGMVSVWNILIALNFFRSLPVEISEAAEIDGASHMDILFQIYLPLSLPMLATLTLFTAVGHWNAWFDGMVLMTDIQKYPLQTYLQSQLQNLSNLTNTVSMDPTLFKYLSERSLRGAQIILTTIPILLLYPFLQRYFIHGLTLGSVKG